MGFFAPLRLCGEDFFKESMKKRWDIFCKVVDNFGDIGVCWRLAKQLAHEHSLQVRLFVDDVQVASKIISTININKTSQIIDSIEINLWNNATVFDATADVVIEAFACELPQSYLDLMTPETIWVNLEYLSAESWVADFHGKHSLIGNKKRHFFFPGFNENTGGLIRENDAVRANQKWIPDTNPHLNPLPEGEEAIALSPSGRKLERGLAGMTADKEAFNISLFCYEHAPLQALFHAAASGTQKATIYAPLTHSIQKIAAFFDKEDLKAGDVLSKNQLTLQVLPFLWQVDYDALLRTCDLNFVRGEDSWVRAIWAGKPFIWQPYAQTEGAHIVKLNAFLDVFYADLSAEQKTMVCEAHGYWLSGQGAEHVWDNYFKLLPEITRGTQAKSQQLAHQPDLASKLLIFCNNA